MLSMAHPGHGRHQQILLNHTRLLLFWSSIGFSHCYLTIKKMIWLSF